MRAPYNVLVLPFYHEEQNIWYCVFKREDMDIWQFIAGGGEDEEDMLTAAKREGYEEAGICQEQEYKKLESMCYASVTNFSKEYSETWNHKYVIPIYSFAVELYSKCIQLSHEHTEYQWCTYDEAVQLLYYDLDRTALYELSERIKNDWW